MNETNQETVVNDDPIIMGSSPFSDEEEEDADMDLDVILFSSSSETLPQPPSAEEDTDACRVRFQNDLEAQHMLVPEPENNGRDGRVRDRKETATGDDDSDGTDTSEVRIPDVAQRVPQPKQDPKDGLCLPGAFGHDEDKDNGDETDGCGDDTSIDEQQSHDDDDDDDDEPVLTLVVCGTEYNCSWICCLGEATCSIFSILGCLAFTAGIICLILFLAGTLMNGDYWDQKRQEQESSSDD